MLTSLKNSITALQPSIFYLESVVVLICVLCYHILLKTLTAFSPSFLAGGGLRVVKWEADPFCVLSIQPALNQSHPFCDVLTDAALSEMWQRIKMTDPQDKSVSA